MKPSHSIRPVFDDPNLVSTAGLVPAMRLAESAGFYDLLDGLRVASPNAAVKTAGVVAAMLAGADSIDDADLLRHGAMARLFSGVRAPSTLGAFLRTFTALHRGGCRSVISSPASMVGASLAGSGDEGIAFVDVDDTIGEVHGYAKQGAGFGYTGVRGLNIQLAAILTPTAAPVIARARLRKGNTASATGAGRMLAQAITTARAAGVTGRVLARADSAYYGWAFVGTAIRHRAWYSVTARMSSNVTAAIAGIAEDAWVAIKYPRAIWEPGEEPGEGRWVSEAEVAEVGFTAFTSRRKSQHVRCRLVVRRVKRLQPRAGDGTLQSELFGAYRHHGFITNSSLGLVEADERHRDHAIIEQVIAELKDAPLAHLPSGKYAANAAWVSHTVIAYNLARASGVAAGLGKARWATLRTHLFNVPARVAATGRRLVLHLPTHWPWAHAWETLHAVATGPPGLATT